MATKGEPWLSLIITLMLDFLLLPEATPSTLILKKPRGGGGGGAFQEEKDEGYGGREVEMAPI